jgi:hypothetical protein
MKLGDVISGIPDQGVEGLADFYRKVWGERAGRGGDPGRSGARRPQHVAEDQDRRSQQRPGEAETAVKRAIGTEIRRPAVRDRTNGLRFRNSCAENQGPPGRLQYVMLLSTT